MDKKVCSKCKEVKPVSEFYESKRTNNGLASQCKKCQKESQKEQKAWLKEKVVYRHCGYCGERFKVDDQRQMFCSRKC